MFKVGIRTLLKPVVSRSIRYESSQILTFHRLLHSSSPNSSKLTNQPYDESDSIRHRLNSEPYYAKREREDGNSNSDEPNQSKPSSKKELKRFEKLEALLGVLTGILTIIGLFGSFALYQKWPAISSWWYKTADDEFKPRKKKKTIELPTISNPNDSSIPGLYLCGDNSNYLVNSNKKVVEQRFPQRHDWFDHKLLKDVVLGLGSALAIDTKGDLIQWGRNFNNDSTPQITVKGEKIQKARISNGVIYALNSKNEILIIPENLEYQKTFKGLTRRNWILQKKTKPYTKLDLSLLKKDEKIVDLQTGKYHLVLLTDKGKAFTSATGFNQQSKSLGQFGIPEFSQFAKPPIPNKLHEIELLNKSIHKDSKGKIQYIEPRIIKQISTGYYHTLALDSNGEVYSFGQNTYGQLGHPVSYDSEIIPYPKKIQLLNKHVKRDIFPEVIDIHSSGETSFCTIKPVQMYKLIKGASSSLIQQEQEELIAKNESFTVGFGNNLKGQIGSGHYVHAQFDPIKVKELSKFEDFNETTGNLERVEIVDWSSAVDHTFIKLANKDVLYWGGNDFGQLGNGKKSRIPRPTPTPALIEPSFTKETYQDLTFVNRLQLNPNQKIVAGETTSAIFYTS